jgi:phasin family protein
MSDRPFDPTSILETYRSAFAPVLKAQEEGVKAIDKVGRYQYAVAGDYLEWSLAQAQLALRAPTPADFFTKQVELTTALSEKLRVRAQEFAALAEEAQAGAADALKQTASAVATSTLKAVDAAQKFSVNSQTSGR